MKKRSFLLVLMVPFLASSIFLSLLSTAQPGSANGSFPFCTDTPQHGQVKVAQVPIPWQFWAIDPETGNIIDRIRISPTWLNPPTGLPRGAGTVLIQRQMALATQAQPLEAMVWDPERDMPMPEADLQWQMVDSRPMEVMAGEDEDLRIPAGNAVAVLVAYPVMTMMGDNAPEVMTGHFINQVVLGQSIAQIMVNFDVHNGTGRDDITNFELEFLGLEITCADILGALGFVVGTGEPWGANLGEPLVVRPITRTLPDGTEVKGTEVKWVQPDRSLATCEWVHLGLAFSVNLPDTGIGGVRATVQGYWTVTDDTPPTVACVETVNPHGKTVPPAGKTTLPGPKGGVNEDGFYRVSAADDETPAAKLKVYVENASGTWRSSAYSNGSAFKVTEAPGATPSEKPMGSATGQAGAIAAHITLDSDPVFVAVDAAGNEGKTNACLVPPPPK